MELESLLDDLASSSPLIMWLKNKLPFLLKSIIISFVIAYISGIPYNKIVLPLFVIISGMTTYAPQLGKNIDYALGYVIAVYLIRRV